MTTTTAAAAAQPGDGSAPRTGDGNGLVTGLKVRVPSADVPGVTTTTALRRTATAVRAFMGRQSRSGNGSAVRVKIRRLVADVPGVTTTTAACDTHYGTPVPACLVSAVGSQSGNGRQVRVKIRT